MTDQTPFKCDRCLQMKHFPNESRFKITIQENNAEPTLMDLCAKCHEAFDMFINYNEVFDKLTDQIVEQSGKFPDYEGAKVKLELKS